MPHPLEQRRLGIFAGRPQGQDRLLRALDLLELEDERFVLRGRVHGFTSD
jgi:hypothetical protein